MVVSLPLPWVLGLSVEKSKTRFWSFKTNRLTWVFQSSISSSPKARNHWVER